MDWASWYQPSTMGWWITVPAAGLFGTYLAFMRVRPPKQSLVPLLFAGLWLGSCVAHYLRSNWHHYIYNHSLWLGGVATIVVAAAMPLTAVLLIDVSTARVVPRHVTRTLLATALGIELTFLLQQPLGFRTAMLV